MSRLVLSLIVALSVAGCGAPDEPLTDIAPALGKSDARSTDSADRGCQVILRALDRVPDENGGFVQKNGYWIWEATVDVAQPLASEGAVAEVLYRPNGAAWYRFIGAPVSQVGGFQRFHVDIDDRTTPTPIMDLRSWEYQRAEVAVLARMPSGDRIFDHNRVPGDLDNYQLVPSSFAVPEAPGICPVAAPRATVELQSGFVQAQHGAIAAGGQVVVDYDLSRLPSCRLSQGGYQLWDVEASMRIEPQGTVVTKSVTQVAQGTRVSVPTVFDVPAGATQVAFWFHNFDAEGQCDTWDSAYGQNYDFPVETLPAPPGWAGDLAALVSRDCGQRSALPDPLVVDEYQRERSCLAVEADVWVPGTTDGAYRPDLIDAQVVWSVDGGAQRTDWLVPEGRVGNNVRFRWELPYAPFRMAGWTSASYAIRFSTDGNDWVDTGAHAIAYSAQ